MCPTDWTKMILSVSHVRVASFINHPNNIPLPIICYFLEKKKISVVAWSHALAGKCLTTGVPQNKYPSS